MNKYRGNGKSIEDPDLPPVPFEPLGNLVVLKMVPQNKSPGGVVLPETVQELDSMSQGLDPRKGWVVAVGCQCRYARRGDLVALGGGQLVSFKWKGQLMWFIQETNLLGIVQDSGGEMPSFAVTDWKDQIVCRAGEACDNNVRPGATVAEVRRAQT